jgi:hypothetical protein
MPASRFETTQSYRCVPTFTSNLFTLIHFRKNASVNALVSHTFKTKDLKPFRFIHFQKKVGMGCRISCFDFRVSSPDFRLSTVDCQLSPVTPLDSALTLKRAAKSLIYNTHEKHTRGEGGPRVECGGSRPLCLSPRAGIGDSSSFQPSTFDYRLRLCRASMNRIASAKLSHQLQLR